MTTDTPLARLTTCVIKYLTARKYTIVQNGIILLNEKRYQGSAFKSIHDRPFTDFILPSGDINKNYRDILSCFDYAASFVCPGNETITKIKFNEFFKLIPPKIFGGEVFVYSKYWLTSDARNDRWGEIYNLIQYLEVNDWHKDIPKFQRKIRQTYGFPFKKYPRRFFGLLPPFSETEEAKKMMKEAMLSYELWKDEFDADVTLGWTEWLTPEEAFDRFLWVVFLIKDVFIYLDMQKNSVMIEEGK